MPGAMFPKIMGHGHDNKHHMMYVLMHIISELGAPMRTTLNIDDQLLDEAQRITGVAEKATLVREGLRALIERESARRLARLGGSEPHLETVPRRQPDPA